MKIKFLKTLNWLKKSVEVWTVHLIFSCCLGAILTFTATIGWHVPTWLFAFYTSLIFIIVEVAVFFNKSNPDKIIRTSLLKFTVVENEIMLRGINLEIKTICRIPVDSLRETYLGQSMNMSFLLHNLYVPSMQMDTLNDYLKGMRDTFLEKLSKSSINNRPLNSLYIEIFFKEYDKAIKHKFLPIVTEMITSSKYSYAGDRRKEFANVLCETFTDAISNYMDRMYDNFRLCERCKNQTEYIKPVNNDYTCEKRKGEPCHNYSPLDVETNIK